jgi:hypothetical protein
MDLDLLINLSICLFHLLLKLLFLHDLLLKLKGFLDSVLGMDLATDLFLEDCLAELVLVHEIAKSV